MPKKQTALVAISGEVIVPGEDRLADIATDIRAEYGKGIEAQFAIGRLLAEARAIHEDDNIFGAWVAKQEFPFGRQQAWRLRWAGENEPEVRAFITAAATTSTRGPDMGVSTAVEYMKRKPKEGWTKEQKAAEKELGQLSRTDSGFAAFRKGVFALLGYEVGEDGEGAFTKDLSLLAADELVELAGLVKVVAAAYNAEKANR